MRELVPDLPGRPNAGLRSTSGRPGPNGQVRRPAGPPRRAALRTAPRQRSRPVAWPRAVQGRPPDGQWITVDRTASESGGKRDIRDDLKTRAAERVAAIPDIAMPAVRRLVERGVKGREMGGGKLYGRLINGERGGNLGYAMWRRYLKLAQGFTAEHKHGIVKYTAHELRHVCASLLIASGDTDTQVCRQMGHSKVETTKNIYGHLFAQDQAFILKAMNQAVTRLYVQDDEADDEQAA